MATAAMISPAASICLPKGSNVVPFCVCYGFWVRDYNILPQKELHSRVWVGILRNASVIYKNKEATVR